MKSRSHRLPTISDTPDDWVDESWTVDCVCGVNFDDGEEMVDCDECGVWVHTRCSRYVKSEKLFSCDKCKSKRLRKESEETEVAELLAELPTTVRIDNPYPMNFPSQNPIQVWTEVPLEEKVHVQGIPGGDPAFFTGVSSVFGPELWKNTGYVPKKFNHQYREFPCWDERQDNDDDDDNKSKEEIENHASNGADALFSLSKENGSTFGGLKTRVNGGGALDMGPPTTCTKKQEVENHEGVRKEKSLLKAIVNHSVNKKKDDYKVSKDLKRKKNIKVMEKEGDSMRDLQEPVSTTPSDAKQSESNEGTEPKVFKTDKQSCKNENIRVDVQTTNHKSDDCVDNNNNTQPLENGSFDDLRINPSKEAKQMVENDGNQVHLSVEISPQTEDGMASSLMLNPMETSTMKHEAGNDVVDDANDNGRNSNTNNLEKVGSGPNGELHAGLGPGPLQPIEVIDVEINHPVKTSKSQNVPTSDIKVDSSKILAQDTRTSNDSLSASFEVKNVDKSYKPDEPDESPSGPSQPKGQMRGPEAQPKSRDQHKVTGSTVTKSSTGKSSTKPSVTDKARYSNTDDHNSSGRKKGPSDCSNDNKSKKDKNSSELTRNRDASEKPKKIAKELVKSSSTSALKSSSNLSKSSHAHVSKKNSGDIKDPAILSSSKTNLEDDKIESLRSERQPATKHHPPHVHPPLSATSQATLSDEELALLLHQELNSSPRVPRVPRMRHAGSLPQLASGTSTSTLMKRTSASGAKDNGPRKKIKDLASNGPNNSREFDGGKKVDRMSSRRHNEVVKNGSTKVDKTVSSGPSSSNEANEHTRNSPQNASDDETGVPSHRTLPGLIADIMSKGKRMTYEELCNAVLPHWPNLRKHNGERYAYSSHSQAVLDCLRNRSEWSRLVDRGPKTNAGRKRRKSEVDEQNVESEEDDDYSTDRNTKDVEDNNEVPKGKRKARKHRRLALQGRGIKDVRRRRKAEVVSDDDDVDSSSSSESSQEFSDDGGTSVPNEPSASSDDMETIS